MKNTYLALFIALITIFSAQAQLTGGGKKDKVNTKGKTEKGVFDNSFYWTFSSSSATGDFALDIDDIDDFDKGRGGMGGGFGTSIGSIIYTYDNSGLVTLRESYEADGTYKGKAVYTNRDTDAYNLTSATYFDQYNNETFRYDVEYTSENGSSISKYYENDELFMTQTWIRDDKMGAYFATDVFPYQHVNNTLSLEARYTSGTIASYSFTSVMEYDADDYPIKETMTKYNGTVSVFTFEYLNMN